MNKTYFDDNLNPNSKLIQETSARDVNDTINKYQQGGILTEKAYRNVKPVNILERLKDVGTSLFNVGNEALSAIEKTTNVASYATAKSLAKLTHNLTDNDLPPTKYEDHANTLQRLNPSKKYTLGEQVAINAIGDPLTYYSAYNILNGVNALKTAKKPVYWNATNINLKHPREARRAKQALDKTLKFETYSGVIGAGVDALDNGVINKEQGSGSPSHQLERKQQSKPEPKKYQQGGRISPGSYLNEVIRGSIEMAKLPLKIKDKVMTDMGKGYSAPGEIANKAAQNVARSAAKYFNGMSDDDLPSSKYESHSETVKRLNPTKSYNFLESMAMDLAGDPTTVIGGDAAIPSIKKGLNAKIIPSTKRILPKNFKVSTSTGEEFGLKYYNTILHDAKNPNNIFGSLKTREANIGMTPTSLGEVEMVPRMVEVKDQLKGNRVQDLLYNENLNKIKQDGTHNHIRTGDSLLQPENTRKFHERSITEAIPRTGDSYVDPNTFEEFFLPVSRYLGPKNKNVTTDVLNRINSLPKTERINKSINDYINTANEYLEPFFKPKPKTVPLRNSFRN